MPTINQLAQTNVITGADQFPVYSATNGDARRAPAAVLLAYIQSAWMDPNYTRVTASPTLAGFTVGLSGASSIFLLLTPTGLMATGTIVLPPASGASDGQEIIIFTTQQITALSFLLNGAAALNGAPSGLGANDSMTLRYDVLSVAWYVISKPSTLGVTNGTFTPVYNGAGIVGTVVFSANYQITGNVVTLGLTITTAAASTLSFTSATDYFDALPGLILPVGDVVSGTPVGDGVLALFGKVAGVSRVIFQKPATPVIVFPASTSIQYTVATYLI
jgi:hypothetical protein